MCVYEEGGVEMKMVGWRYDRWFLPCVGPPAGERGTTGAPPLKRNPHQLHPQLIRVQKDELTRLKDEAVAKLREKEVSRRKRHRVRDATIARWYWC